MKEKLKKFYVLLDELQKDAFQFVKDNGGFINTSDSDCDAIYCSAYMSDCLEELQIVGVECVNNLLMVYTSDMAGRFLPNLTDDEVRECPSEILETSGYIVMTSAILNIAESIDQYVKPKQEKP